MTDPVPEDAREKAYLEPYRRAVEAEGATWGAQLWRSPQAQRARFDAIAGMVDLRGRDLVDMGCGRGDLAAYLVEKGIAVSSYLGVDGIGEVARAASERASSEGWARASFITGDMVADADLPGQIRARSDAPVVVFSGSLSTLDEAAARGVLARFWDEACAGAGSDLVFNFLCRRAGDPAQHAGDPARRFDPDAMLAWALGLGGHARYRRDYLGTRDATIALRRGA